EADPLGVQPGVVERIDHDQGERRVQEDVRRDAGAPQPRRAPHRSAPRPKRAASAARASAESISINDNAAPKGQSRVSRNCCLITLPIMMPLVPPRRSGMAKMPTAGMNTSAAPANTPGRDKGNVTRQK